MAPMPELHQHGGRLAKGQFPRSDQECEHKADQEVVEEFQRIADDGRRKDLDLVAGQSRPAIENLEHGVSPWRLFIAVRSERRASAIADGERLSSR